MVGRGQRHWRLDALQRRRSETRADGDDSDAARRDTAIDAHGNSFQWKLRLRRRALYLCYRRRNHLRLEWRAHGRSKIHSPTQAIYKGATIAQANGVRFLYVTNFFNGSVDVFDTNYAPTSVPAGAFTDPNIPSGFAPFNVQNINGNLYVTFAKQSADKHDDLHGPGLAFVDAFHPNRVFLLQFNHVPSI